MTTPTDLLRQEHRQIRSRLGSIRSLADKLDDMPEAAAAVELENVLEFLEHGLVPHALAEDGLLYPAVALVMGASQATATMSRDHLEIARLTSQLRYLVGRAEPPSSRRRRRDVRRVLYAIDAIVSLHLDKEEEIYLPLLDGALSAEAATELMADVDRASHASTRAS